MAAEIPRLDEVTVKVLERPRFNNKNLADRDLWQIDNAVLLASYWTEQGNVLELAPSTADLDVWLDVQHDIEWSLHHRRLLPHGSENL